MELEEIINIEICMPRIYNVQRNRVNIISDNPETFFKRLIFNIFIPFLDYLVESMDRRFDKRLSTQFLLND